MTKAELVGQIAAETNITKAGAERSLNAFLDSVKNALLTDGKLTLTGFGAFSVETREARKGRNPRTGVEINIPASRVIKFRPGKNLKDSVR